MTEQTQYEAGGVTLERHGLLVPKEEEEVQQFAPSGALSLGPKGAATKGSHSAQPFGGLVPPSKHFDDDAYLKVGL